MVIKVSWELYPHRTSKIGYIVTHRESGNSLLLIKTGIATNKPVRRREIHNIIFFSWFRSFCLCRWCHLLVFCTTGVGMVRISYRIPESNVICNLQQQWRWERLVDGASTTLGWVPVLGHSAPGSMDDARVNLHFTNENNADRWE